MRESFYAMLMRMKYINRWGLMKNSRYENLSEHTLDVAVITHGLVVIENNQFGGSLDAGKAVLYALYHDVSEILTGDMPTPAKYYSEELRQNYKQLETRATERIVSLIPDTLRGDYEMYFSEPPSPYREIVKAADRISAIVKCIEEERSGNTEFKAAKEAQEQALCEMKLPCANYFVEHFLGAFEKPLDKIGL